MKIFCYFLIIVSVKNTLSQNPNAVQVWKLKNTDRWMYSVAIVHSLGNWIYAKNNAKEPIKINQFRTFLDKQSDCDVNKKSALRSDVLAGTHAFGGLAIAILAARNKNYPLFHDAAQSVWITYNVNQTVKMLTHRGRPYTFGKNPTQFNKKNDAYSFFSMHSSIAASISTTLWLNHKTLTGNKNANFLICTGSTILTLGTGYLRISAHKHYTSDVITGFICGSLISFGVHQLHKGL